jgi:putative transposase
MVLGFAIYLEKPGAFTAGLAIMHAGLPKEDWLAAIAVQAEWPCLGKVGRIHGDNAKEFSWRNDWSSLPGSRYRRDHHPPREPRRGSHIEYGFGTRSRRLKGTTFSNVDYDSEGRAIMIRAELENGSLSTSPRSMPTSSTMT